MLYINCLCSWKTQSLGGTPSPDSSAPSIRSRGHNQGLSRGSSLSPGPHICASPSSSQAPPPSSPLLSSPSVCLSVCGTLRLRRVSHLSLTTFISQRCQCVLMRPSPTPTERPPGKGPHLLTSLPWCLGECQAPPLKTKQNTNTVLVKHRLPPRHPPPPVSTLGKGSHLKNQSSLP